MRDAAPVVPAWLAGSPGAWRLRVIVHPGAARTQIVGEHDGSLRLKIAAPPVDGRANDELLRFLARCLQLPVRELSIVAGAGARRKSVEMRTELDAAMIIGRLSARSLPGPPIV